MADPTVEVRALDEVHFQQHGSRCRMWVPPEVRDPVSLHHPTRRQVGYFGAVRLADRRFSTHSDHCSPFPITPGRMGHKVIGLRRER